ncbi:MAG TPA: hypothetical protein VFZ59_20960, partial [Verrucomicrobiae bacterium]|nr:hypothetical protein [Verrucomicrobiae bacterium]
IGASGLVVVISTNAVQAAPVGLALTISTAAVLSGVTLATTATATATKVIALTTVQKTVIATTIAVLAGVATFEAYQAAQLRKQVQSLQEQQISLMDQTQQLHQEHENATGQLSALREDNERLSRNANELLKLRGEVGLLRQQASELETLRTNTASNNPLPIKPDLHFVEYGLDPTFLPKLQKALPPMPGESNQDLLVRYFKENKLELQTPATMFWDERKDKLLVRAPPADQERIRILFVALLNDERPENISIR